MNGQLVYQNKTNPFLNEMMLWAKVHVGTKEMIEADWPGAKKAQARAE